ncbi:SH2 domain-containing protein 4A-like [Bradysia coprophila]|uniref:SH2 domain-containing protein 4A-like n=1 Tax=Bradysia coprophila TaxID=38358 RepID=UPI00187D800C|nr:SH2 domain-containing protein 4A-like [Bradysia coprophila]
MLKQILREMYIDPEILAGLDETQKQTLFCKMREEQIRRWRLWDQKYEQNLETIEQNKLNKTNDKRSVSFRTGDDGEVWVWVMGEHPDDKTIEEILADEAKREARELAEIETKEYRRSYVAEFSDFSEIIDYDSDSSINKIDNVELDTPKIDDMEIYCSVDELRDRLKTNNISSKTTPKINSFTQSMYSSRIPNYNLSSTNNVDKVENLKDSVQKPSQKVSAKIALWEKRVINEKTNEIYKRIQKKQQESVKEAEEAARKQEEFWQEQEKKSKEAECQMRAIARRAREEHRKSMTTEQLNEFSNDDNSPLVSSSPPSSLDSNISKPPSQDAVLKWYRGEEFPKGCGINSDDGKPFQWFHGLVTRLDAEDLLSDEPRGTFLVRVSEKIWGYAISYKDGDRCKHYLVDTSSGTYQFLGANQLTHKSLNDLIFYHAHVPITMSGNELLLEPRLQTSDCPKILDGLL